MSVSTVFLAFAAFLVGAFVPQSKSTKQRVGLGLVAAAAVALIAGLWPDPNDAKTLAKAVDTSGEWRYQLTSLIFVPILGSIAVLFLPRQGLTTMRYFAYGVMGLTFVVSLYMLKTPMTQGWHFVHTKTWIPGLGIRYHVAADGISLWLILLTTFITPIAAFASFGSIKTRVKELCFAFLFLEGTMIGAFVALDLFLFYVFFEAMLVPMYLMIGIWGGAEKIKAAIKFFLYTMFGSMLMLAAIVYLVWTHQKITGEYTFDYLALSRVQLPTAPKFFFNLLNPQAICFWAFSIAFFIKVPMWPVHTWLPDAHVQAPTGGSVILAAVMLKFGTYGYMRFSMGLFPYAAADYAPHVAGIAILGGIVWAALVAWKQDDVKKLIAYSSVAHLGYIMLGLFGATPAGMQGAVLQMVNHGISTGALFLLVGVIYDRKHTRLVKDYGGIAKVMPVYTTLFLIATFASVGVPGTNGFVGEFMVIMGTYGAVDLGNFAGFHAVGAAFGVILAAVYMLSVVQKVFFGKLDPKNRDLTDISPRETLALAPLVVMIFVIGFFPSIFLSRMEPSVRLLQSQYRVVAESQKNRDASPSTPPVTEAMLLPERFFSPAFFAGAPTWPEPEPEAPAAAATAKAASVPAASATAAARPATRGSASAAASTSLAPPSSGSVSASGSAATTASVSASAVASSAPSASARASAQPAASAPRGRPPRPPHPRPAPAPGGGQNP